LKAHFPDQEFVVADPRRLPFPDQSVGPVFTNSTPPLGNAQPGWPPIDEGEVWRILKPEFPWLENGVPRKR
jgi:hypothetical protein